MKVTPWIVAHRGARDEAPENTAAAFDRALTYGIDGIELDVQMTADGVPVLYHDRTLWKIAGSRRRIASLRLSELQTVDWGRWYHPDFAGEPLLTLEETLYRYLPRTRLFIEIKSRSGPRRPDPVESVQAVGRLLRRPDLEAHAARRAFVLSFDLEVLRRLRQGFPELRCVWNLPERTAEKALAQAPAEGREWWGCCVRLQDLGRSLVEKAHGRGMRCFTYSCNTPAQLRKVRPLAPDAVLTDRPGWLCRTVRSPGSGASGPPTPA